MGRVVWGLALAGSVACGTTGPSPQPPLFPGTLFMERGRALVTDQLEQPVGIDGLEREFQVPLDLSPYYPGDPPSNYPALVHDFDVSRDGKYLYVATYVKVVRFELPAGGRLRELASPGPVATVRVSPDGRLIAYQLSVGHETRIMNADGSSPRIVLPAASGTEEIGEPVSVGSDRLLVPITKELYPVLETVVMDVRAPDWTATEYLPLHNRIPGVCCGRGPLLATPDGTKLYVSSLNIADELILTEYPIGSSAGTQRITFPKDAGGRMVISPDGQTLVTIGPAENMLLFDLATGAKLGIVERKRARPEAPMAWTSAEYPEAVGGP